MSTTQSSWVRTGVFVAVMLAVPIIPFVIIGELPGARWLHASRGEDVAVGALGAALLGLDVLLPIPSSVIGSLLGARLGFVSGFTFTSLGLIVGHTMGYGLGRAWPRRFHPNLHTPATLWLVFISRPVPVLAEATSVAAGAARISFLRYLLACAAGDLIYAAALCATGARFLPEDRYVLALIFPLMVPVLSWCVWKAMARRREKT